MLIEIVRFKDSSFFRDLVPTANFDVKKLNDSDVLAYRFIASEEDIENSPSIYDWNLCSELKNALKPVPDNLTPEILYLFRKEFLDRAVELVEDLKATSNLDESALYSLLYKCCNVWGKSGVLFDKNIASVLKDISNN